jgi:hypothetical protein
MSDYEHQLFKYTSPSGTEVDFEVKVLSIRNHLDSPFKEYTLSVIMGHGDKLVPFTCSTDCLMHVFSTTTFITDQHDVIATFREQRDSDLAYMSQHGSSLRKVAKKLLFD